MASKEHQVRICLGSSCFSRGNKQHVKFIQEYLLEHGLDRSVDFRGAHCFEKCQEGPFIEIDGQLHPQIDQNQIESLLRQLKERVR